MSEGIEIRRTPSLCNDQPYLAEGAGVRVVDIVDRVRAGDSELDVAKDFGVKLESVRLLVEVAEAVTEGERDIARRERKRVHRTENAARELWDAVTAVWPEDEMAGMDQSSMAYPGASIRGKELYEIGVALGFIEDSES